MELDPRIKSKNDILTCFDTKEAGQFLAQEGYFSDCFAHYRCLASRKYGILTEIKDSDCPFKEGNNEFWRFFIPESRLLETTQKESKYIPCTLDNFGLNIGDLIRFRRKDDHNIEIGTMYMGYMMKTNRTVKVLLGQSYYSFEVLFNDYEWFDKDSNTWEVFGVKE